MVELVKRVAAGAYNAGQPVAVLLATVTKANPLEVNVEQRLTLSEDFLLVSEQVTRYEQTVGNTTLVIRPGLAAGDTVLLLRVQGGQRYVVMDKVV